MKRFFNAATSYWPGNFVRDIAALAIILQIVSCVAPKNHVDFREVKKGNQLNKAREIKLDTFLTFWLDNRHYRGGAHCIELYKDSVFTYFGLFHYHSSQNFCKVQNDILAKIDYKSISGDSIREKFYYEIIPEEDRKKADECTDFGSSGCSFKYRYIESENAIEIDCHYKVRCDFIPKVNKHYDAKYDIKNKSLKKIDLPVSP